MPETKANGVMIHYEDHGNPSDPAMLLIMGFGAQLTLWPDELVEALVAQGFRVIRYDNRDVGFSQKFTGDKEPGPVKLTLLKKIGLTPKVPYTLADMAEDAVGLLDALHIDRAHIVGASMGGMIAQHVAANHADRCLSFTQIFSTTGKPKLPAARKEALQALVKRPDSTEEAALVAHGMHLARTIGSPAYPAEEERLRERVQASIRRCDDPYPARLGPRPAAGTGRRVGRSDRRACPRERFSAGLDSIIAGADSIAAQPRERAFCPQKFFHGFIFALALRPSPAWSTRRGVAAR